MKRALLLIGAALALTAACNRAADDEARAEKAQAVANDKITSATLEVNQKIAGAQAEADRKITEAQASFMKLRESYRHDVTDTLTKLDEETAKLATNEPILIGPSKTDFDARMSKIRAERDTVAEGFTAMETASAVTWDDAKARLDQELRTLKALVEGS